MRLGFERARWVFKELSEDKKSHLAFWNATPSSINDFGEARMWYHFDTTFADERENGVRVARTRQSVVLIFH